LNRAGEAQRRLEDAVSILKETRDYPSEQIALDSVLCAVLVALADHHADEGRLTEAIGEYQQLLERVMTAKPDIDHDLRDAYSLSLLYQSLGELQQRAGASQAADAIGARRVALWNEWNRKLPNNPFVLRRLAEAQVTRGASPAR
jgi:tetratricopeptide (TPR) repeat protein